MDFITGLLRINNGCDAIGIIVDRFTKIADFFTIKIIDLVSKLACLYVDQII